MSGDDFKLNTARVVLSVILLAANSALAFSIEDSQHAALHGSPIFWLDDKRILFGGPRERNPVRERVYRPALLLWELGKSPATYRERLSALVCYSDGRVSYFLSDEADVGKRQFYEGAFGKEQPRPLPKRIDRRNCDSDELARKDPADRLTFWLMPRHGFLDLGPRSNPLANNSVIYRSADRGLEVTLPFSSSTFAHRASYHTFRNAYFLPTKSRSVTRAAALSSTDAKYIVGGYWLWPTGTTEPVQVPGNIAAVFATRVGLAYRIFATNTPIDGLYLFSYDRERKRVAQGYVVEMAVSPDGCKLAFISASDADSDLWQPMRPSNRSLKVANLCEGSAPK